MSNHPYDQLTMERVMDAIESLGFTCDARILTLNSYENRVYQVGIESEQPIIAKFYRPDRWSQDAIQEEHDFLQELASKELPVVAPLVHNQASLFQEGEFFFALFPRRGGHAPELSNEGDLQLLGRYLGRLHAQGEAQAFQHRPSIQGQRDLEAAARQVLEETLIPYHLMDDYRRIMDALITWFAQYFNTDTHLRIRLHGDLHPGNLLLRDDTLYMVDFDDCLSGPAMQDIWMLLSGERHEQLQQLNAIRSGYEMFRNFPVQELPLIDALRTLRIARHAGWLCQRWHDPAFPLAFPWVDSDAFWQQHISSLTEQFNALQEAPLTMSTLC